MVLRRELSEVPWGPQRKCPGTALTVRGFTRRMWLLMTRSAYRFPAPGRSKDLSKSLYTYLLRSGLRMLNDEHKKAPVSEVPSVEVICDLLWDLCRQKGDNVIAWYDPDSVNISGKRSKITCENAERLCRNAAERIHEAWDPFYCEKRSELARRPRPRARKATVADLLALPEGLSKAQSAEALGCSTATVARLRAAALSDTASAIKQEMTYAQVAALSDTPTAWMLDELMDRPITDMRGPRTMTVDEVEASIWWDYFGADAARELSMV